MWVCMQVCDVCVWGGGVGVRDRVTTQMCACVRIHVCTYVYNTIDTTCGTAHPPGEYNITEAATKCVRVAVVRIGKFS